MLDKRTNILFDRELWQTLSIAAKNRNASIGELIREAVRQTYSREEKQERIAKACQTIFALRKKYRKIDYKKLINYGRRH